MVPVADWTLLTNHARVLLCVAREENFRLRDIAACVGITERATHRIVSDLCDAGYMTRHRLGTRNYYEINVDAPLRHPYDSGNTVADLLAALLPKRPARDEQSSGVGAPAARG